jgi:hypothetical protein
VTTLSFDVSYGTRAVPLRLPYLSVRRHAPAVAAPHQRRDPDATRAVLRALAERERATDRARAVRGIGL